MLCDGLRRRTGRLGVCGGASIMVVSDELLLPDAERERDCGVDVREAISWYVKRIRHKHNAALCDPSMW